MYIPEEQQRQIGHFFLTMGFFGIKKIIEKIYQPEKNVLSSQVLEMQKKVGLLKSQITYQIQINECIKQLLEFYDLQLVSEKKDDLGIEDLNKTLYELMAKKQELNEQSVVPYTGMNKFNELNTYLQVCYQQLIELMANQQSLQNELECVIKNQNTFINTSKASIGGTRLFF
ncbi:MAG: hypothetical protein BGO90_14780 [Legionella sp. 40-6]|nr:hypothetical protein [Legionella sp.]OJY26548.1 MAG: hypothetical protein BGO90_14780 [Legionella sp. 40-6]